ncbi:LuxR C-terminal-related transcriptional regulator [Ktedonobacter racemifer]|uniref:ATP-dependent transcriptional regulator, MalT-like, LuxR family n=1 Tax=Ktedonobacter racemifer DSM 44963 TaxID=485913 RepID=D6U894_KTERA|nr:LuxR C-terminal-related transcriptional regulator [Ktedonobacter racemifer]EFH80105.1 ATP-dependent transcriptional regulator, MalT-like, LuxR family [Ktedonobacter racemifer DSM 44963]
MPKTADCGVIWRSERVAYDIYQDQRRHRLSIEPGSQEWFDWLAAHSSFSFQGKNGAMTVCQERRQRGGSYWYAYRRNAQKVVKKYLGRSRELTVGRLEEVAQQLQQTRGLPNPQGGAALSQRSPVALAAQFAFATHSEKSSELQQTTLAPRLAADSPLFLTTRLSPPPVQQPLIRRERLFALLEQGTMRTLTILSAAAGFGKTTLLAQWLAEYHHPVAWLTCEAEDNEMRRFLSYLIAAFQQIEPGLGMLATELLQKQPLTAWEAVLPALSNDLASLPTCLLVLDDYQLIISRDSHSSLDYLLSHLPPQIHVLLSSRTTPPLTLGRLRVNRQLFEIDEGDLRLNALEIARYFSELMQRPLLPEEVQLLEQRTEGWIAGVQLAALLLQKHAGMGEVLNAFTGQHRFVYRYLFEEILAHQPPEWEAFLVQTSLLSRLNASLCEMVTGQSHGQETLEALEEARLFLYPLDEERCWYRYHPLFAEMLHARLQQTGAELVPELHRRACTWYARHMLIPEAVRHALAIPDTRQALHLILPDKDTLSQEVPLQTMLEWVRALPEALLLEYPELHLHYVTLLLITYQFTAAEAHLEIIERSVYEREEHVVEQETRLGEIALLRGFLAIYQGDLARGFFWEQQAARLLSALSEKQTIALFLSSLLQMQKTKQGNPARSGEPSRENAVLKEFRSPATLFRLVHSAFSCQQQGKLRRAQALYERAAQLIEQQKQFFPDTSLNITFYFGLGYLRWEQNNLKEAESILTRGYQLLQEIFTSPSNADTTWQHFSKQFSKMLPLIQNEILLQGISTLAEIASTQGDVQRAHIILRDFAQLIEPFPLASALLPQISAQRAAISLRAGQLTEALTWAEQQGISLVSLPEMQEQRSYMVQFRLVLIQAHGRLQRTMLRAAQPVLHQLLREGKARTRPGNSLELLILLAVVHEMLGEHALAQDFFSAVLEYVRLEGYRSSVVRELPLLEPLLRTIAESSPAMSMSLQSILTAGSLNAPSTIQPDHLALLRERTRAGEQILSPREREVLLLLSTGASNQEIANQLIITLGTVKRHVNTILATLQVSNRTQAVARARELSLL